MRRVLFVCEARAVGGAEVYLERLARGMTRWRARVAVPRRPELETWGRRLAAAGVETVPVAAGPAGWPALAGLARDADLVHVNLPNTYDGHAGLLPWVLARAGRPVVVTEHLTRLPRSRRRLWTKRRTDAAVVRRIVVSPSSGSDLRGLGFDRVRLVLNGVPDPGPAAPLPPEPSVAVAASLEPRKGLDVLVDAAARVEGVRITVAGDGPEADALRARAARLGVSDRVVFAGRLDGVGDLFAAHRVAALPSRLEALPLSLLEAMAAGRGVLVSDLPGLDVLVDPGVQGRLLPPGDVDAWADALRGLVERPAESGAWAGAARRRYEERFTLQACVAATEAVFDEAVPA